MKKDIKLGEVKEFKNKMRKTYVPYKKPCRKCDKIFRPTTKACRVCDECNEKSRLERNRKLRGKGTKRRI